MSPQETHCEICNAPSPRHRLAAQNPQDDSPLVTLLLCGTCLNILRNGTRLEKNRLVARFIRALSQRTIAETAQQLGLTRAQRRRMMAAVDKGLPQFLKEQGMSL